MKFKDYFHNILQIIIVFGFFTVLIFLIWKGDYKNEVSLVIGALIGSYLTVVNYNYSSTKGSSDKTEMIYNSTKLPDQSKTETTSQTTSETDIKPPL